MDIWKGLTIIFGLVFFALFFPEFQIRILGGNNTGALGNILSAFPAILLIMGIVIFVTYALSRRGK